MTQNPPDVGNDRDIEEKIAELRKITEEAHRDVAVKLLTQALADRGMIIEAGWVAMRALAIHPNAPPIQLSEMRLAYMAGAQHTWASLMNMFDEGDDATPMDERRMELIAAEMNRFNAELRAWVDREKKDFKA